MWSGNTVTTAGPLEGFRARGTDETVESRGSTVCSDSAGNTARLMTALHHWNITNKSMFSLLIIGNGRHLLWKALLNCWSVFFAENRENGKTNHWGIVLLWTVWLLLPHFVLCVIAEQGCSVSHYSVVPFKLIYPQFATLLSGACLFLFVLLFLSAVPFMGRHN